MYEITTEDGSTVYKNNDPRFSIEFPETLHDGKRIRIKSGVHELSWEVANTQTPNESIDEERNVCDDNESEFIDWFDSEENETQDDLNGENLTEFDTDSQSDSDVAVFSKAFVSNAEPVIGKAASKLSGSTKAVSTVYYSKTVGDKTVGSRYNIEPLKLKEDIVLEQPHESFTYEILLFTNDTVPVLNDDGSIVFVDEDGEGVFTVPAPYMYDAAFVGSDDVNVELSQIEEHSYSIKFIPDADWLNDPERVYPVVIDPTVTIVGDSSCVTDYSIAPQGVHGTDTFLVTGKYSGYQCETLIKFNSGLSVPRDANVSACNLKLYVLDTSVTVPTVSMHAVRGQWEAGDVSYTKIHGYDNYCMASSVNMLTNEIGDYYYCNLNYFAYASLGAVYDITTLNGFLFTTASTTEYVRFCSSEYPNAFFRPILYATYTRNASKLLGGKYVFESACQGVGMGSGTDLVFLTKCDDDYWTVRYSAALSLYLGVVYNNGSYEPCLYNIGSGNNQIDITTVENETKWSMSVVPGTTTVRLHPKNCPNMALTVKTGVTYIYSASDTTLTSTSNTNERQRWNLTLCRSSYTFAAPLDSNLSYKINSPWGYRQISASNSKFHKGIDINVNEHIVYASADGIVSEAHTKDDNDRGLYVEIRHIGISNGGNGCYYTAYQHLKLDSILVQKNSIVKKGQPIATSGNTGVGSGPHLHFEVWNDSNRKQNTINPLTLYHRQDYRANVENMNPVFFLDSSHSGTYTKFEYNDGFYRNFDDDSPDDGEINFVGSYSVSVAPDHGYTKTKDN